ncbi:MULTISPECIES: glutamate--tRNA ligase [unclassified Lentimicrobium]|uniref:glutamate--tRNA ligase n=1 Tax=unclassified Lentimicrobium TaxID=2677434 RepID=UPI0015533791|nr:MULTISPECIES: glutamate--tRNA ligase [unclassified Lentimicrobium]NPD47138.1 glutamate--tRNA ligase [Lentimicrobium sp. S6]NPD86779.1 glutamate--tRNA ligase [Lentimicrobium sp. L6]
MSNIRVRFAPSPTGPLHIGGVRTALYNYLFAKKNGGKMILRIEDTDQTRFVEGAEDYIKESLKWCGINFDEGIEGKGEFGPYKQSERKELYIKYAQELIDSGCAYYAFDTAEELNSLRDTAEAEKSVFTYNAETRKTLKNSLTLSADETKALLTSSEYVIRFKMPEDEEVTFTDAIRGDVTVNTSRLDDKILFKSDGMPTYHLANIVDDHLMEISHVIRGEEWLPSAPLHVMLYRAYKWEEPIFAHLPIILKPVGKGKLSKRDGDKMGFPVFPMSWKDPKTDEVFAGYKENGFFPDSFINMLALLGWNPGTEQEIFSMEELIAAFSLERVGKSGAKFDPDKTNWFNQQYMKNQDEAQLLEALRPILIENGVTAYDDSMAIEVIGLVKERCVFVKDIWEQASYFFQTPTEYNPKVIKKRWKENTPNIITDIKEILENTDTWEAVPMHDLVTKYIEEKEIGFGAVMNALRLAIVGDGKGPDLFKIIELIGKEEAIKRLTLAVENIKR